MRSGEMGPPLCTSAHTPISLKSDLNMAAYTRLGTAGLRQHAWRPACLVERSKHGYVYAEIPQSRQQAATVS